MGKTVTCLSLQQNELYQTILKPNVYLCICYWISIQNSAAFLPAFVSFASVKNDLIPSHPLEISEKNVSPKNEGGHGHFSKTCRCS